MTAAQPDSYAVIKRVTVVGGVVDGSLGVLKMLIGWFGHSQALIADGVHSLSDLLTDILVIWAARHAHTGPDETHPYGHERIETLATLLLSLALILIAAGFVWDSVLRLWEGDRLSQPGLGALIVAVISMLAKEALFHYTRHAAERVRSPSLRANAWHSRSDALSSLVVLLGVMGVMAGFPAADIWATLGVAMMIGWVGWKLGYDGVMELIDTAVDGATLATMQRVIAAVPGVEDVHQIRTRKMAEKIVMDAHVIVSPKISVSEGHRIGDAVEHKLYQSVDGLSDVTIHIDHEPDDTERPGYTLPLREELLAAIATQLGARGLPVPDNIRLHYLGGKIEVEVWQPLPHAADPDQWGVRRRRDNEVCAAIAELALVSKVVAVYRASDYAE